MFKLTLITMFLTSDTPRQPTRLTTTSAVEINRRKKGDQFDPWQVVPRQVFTRYDCLLISVAFVVLCRVDCLWVTSVFPRNLSERNYLKYTTWY